MHCLRHFKSARYFPFAFGADLTQHCNKSSNLWKTLWGQ